jgi:hypothetical protein
MAGRDRLRNLGALVPRDPPEPDRSGWAVVTDDSPLMIRMDHETVAFEPSATLVAGLAINDRVWVTEATSPDPSVKARSVVIIGKAQ